MDETDAPIRGKSTIRAIIELGHGDGVVDPTTLKVSDNIMKAVQRKMVQFFKKLFIDKAAPVEAYEHSLLKEIIEKDPERFKGLKDQGLSTQEAAYYLHRTLPATASAEGVAIKKMLDPLTEAIKKNPDTEQYVEFALTALRNNDIKN